MSNNEFRFIKLQFFGGPKRAPSHHMPPEPSPPHRTLPSIFANAQQLGWCRRRGQHSAVRGGSSTQQKSQDEVLLEGGRIEALGVMVVQEEVRTAWRQRGRQYWGLTQSQLPVIMVYAQRDRSWRWTRLAHARAEHDEQVHWFSVRAGVAR